MPRRFHLEAPREPGRRGGPVGQQADEPAAAESVRDVERGEVQPVLRGRRDARLVLARERVGGCPASVLPVAPAFVLFGLGALLGPHAEAGQA